jgi:hypothetical protein
MTNLTPAQVMARLASGNVISGLWNCHKQGLHSLVLTERRDEIVGMTRVFWAAKGHSMKHLIAGDDFNLLPHNHRQAIKLELLWGEVSNYAFAPCNRDDWPDYPLYEYKFSSAIADDGMAVEKTKFQWMWEVDKASVGTGKGAVELEAHSVHTVVVRSETAAWVVYEGPVSKMPSLCYSLKPDLKLSSQGLYIPMSKSDIRDACEKLLENAND